jgi:hypothetical protein
MKFKKRLFLENSICASHKIYVFLQRMDEE